MHNTRRIPLRLNDTVTGILVIDLGIFFYGSYFELIHSYKMMDLVVDEGVRTQWNPSSSQTNKEGVPVEFL